MNLLPAISLRGKSESKFIRNSSYGRKRKDLFDISLVTTNSREKKREKERDELWKKLSELEIDRRNTLTASSNNAVPATNTPTTRTRP